MVIWGYAAGWAGAATITGFTPDRGTTGTEVTIFGSGLQTATFVYFGSTDAPGEIVARGVGGVRARVPANAFTGPISVFTSGSGAASSAQFFVAPPRVEEVFPVTASPGALVTISGVNFGTGLAGGRGAVTNVLFNGVAARFQITSQNQLTAIVPTDATSGPVTVGNEAGTFTTLFRFEMPAVLTRFDPGAGRPGDAIAVQGRNLESAVRVEVGSISAPFGVVSPTNLVVYLPTNAINGRIQVTTPAGVSTSSSNVVVLPRIISFSPAFGAAGTGVVLQGGGFQGLTEVQFNGLRATVSTRTTTRVEVVVPSGAETGPIRLVTTNGTFVTETDFGLPARVTGLNPGNGRRGDVITVDGQNFRGATRVTVNGVEAAFTAVSGGRLTFTVPALATSGRVGVTTPAGEVLSPASLTVRPILDGVLPANGPVGSVFNLHGAALTNLAWVRLGGTDVSFTVLNSTNLRAIVPLGAFSGPVRVRAADGTELETAGNFFVDGARPTVTSFAPASGPAGAKVLLQGNGLRSASRVQFNGTDAGFVVKSMNQIEATVPAGATSGVLAVTTLDGLALTAAEFVVEQEAEVTLGFEIGPGTLTLVWPAAATGYVLESSARWGTDANWQPVGQAPVSDGTVWRAKVVLPQTNQRFFRLRK